MVAAALPGDRHDVSVGRLPQTGVRPHGDGVVAVEVAEHPPARLAGPVEPGALAAPRECVAPAGVAFDDGMATQLRRVRCSEGGLVTDMGSLLSFSFHDPDDGWHEVIWVKPGGAENGLKRPPDWKMIDLD